MLIHIIIMESKKDEQTIGHLIIKGFYTKLVLIGFPYEEGCLISKHRRGTKYGPDSFRRFLTKVGTVTNAEYNVDLSQIGISDYGNIVPPSGFPTIEEALKKLKAKVTLNFQRKQIPIVIGGSRDYVGYCVEAFSSHYATAPKLVYVCPYLDMKNDKGSNSSVKYAYEHCPKQLKIIHFGLSAYNDIVDMEEAKKYTSQIISQSDIKKSSKHECITKAGYLFKELLCSLKSDIYVSFTMESIKV